MKTIAIISVYPSNDKVVNILNRCIFAYKSAGIDTLVVSHLPLDKDVAKNATYTIYDSNNTFLEGRYCPKFFNNMPTCKVEINTGGHTLPICRNMKLSTNLAKALGYDNFIFTEADVVLTMTDLSLLLSFIEEMVSQDKKMVFFKPKEYVDINGSCVYETLLFAGNLSYFLDTFTPPLTTEEWISIPMGYTLELSFYERFSHDESKFLIIDDHSSSVFSNSDVNLLRYGFYNCEMIYNTPNPERVMLYLMNYALEDSIVKYINIYKNNALLKTLTLFRSGYWFTDFEIDGSEVIVETYVDENKRTLESSKKFVLNQELLVNCLQVGKFELV